MVEFQIRRLRWHWRMRKEKNKKQKQKHSVRTSIKHLPSGILLDILNRLPITSLSSVKLVCKAFYHLVNLLHYQDFHKLIIRILPSTTNKPYNNNQLYFIDNRRFLRKIIQPRIEKKFEAGPILSSNGLLCVLYYKKKRHSSFDHYRACLFNPLTGDHKFLLDPGLPRVPRIGESSDTGNLVWPKQFFGFGFDARTDEYKLIRIVRFSPKDVRTNNLQVEVFTLGKNVCRTSKIDAPFVCPHQSSDVVVGGAIHWLCEDGNSTLCDPKIILSFDLFEEKFHHIPKPNCEVCEFRNISVLGGCLAITGGFRETGRTHEVHIWLLKEYGVESSWTREFVISQGFCTLYPLFLLNNGEIVMSFGSTALCCYDPDRDCFSGIAELNQSIVAICHACGLVSPFGL